MWINDSDVARKSVPRSDICNWVNESVPKINHWLVGWECSKKRSLTGWMGFQSWLTVNWRTIQSYMNHVYYNEIHRILVPNDDSCRFKSSTKTNCWSLRGVFRQMRELQNNIWRSCCLGIISSVMEHGTYSLIREQKVMAEQTIQIKMLIKILLFI